MNAHGLAEPTTLETLDLLRRTCGDDAPSAWARACAEAGVDPSDRDLGPVKLLSVAKQLAAMGGRPSIIGNCMWVRLDSYDQLEGSAG